MTARYDPPLVVGLCGPIGSGKDTAANVLTALHGFTRVALGDPLRSALAEIGGQTGSAPKELAAAGLDARWAHRRLGTECREAVDAPDLWADTLLAKLTYLLDHHPARRHRFAVPDVRYPHEAEALTRFCRARGGKFLLWRLERPSDAPADTSHSSERHYDELPVTDTLRNVGSLEDLSHEVSDLLALGRAREDAAPTRLGDWMMTHSGVNFFPYDPRPEDVRFPDVARALALTPRFAGHLPCHYSLAQHCVLVAGLVAAWGEGKVSVPPDPESEPGSRHWELVVKETGCLPIPFTVGVELPPGWEPFTPTPAPAPGKGPGGVQSATGKGPGGVPPSGPGPAGARAPGRGEPGWPYDEFGPEAQLAALLHDSEEAYFHDVNSPVKYHNYMSKYRAAALAARRAVLAAAGLPPDLPRRAEQADRCVTAAEALALKRPAGAWRRRCEGANPWPHAIRPWPWREAEARFLDLFHALHAGRPRAGRARRLWWGVSARALGALDGLSAYRAPWRGPGCVYPGD